MEMSGERLIAADRAEVWRALNDPEVLKLCIPGCQEIEKTSDTSFTAKVVQKVGPVKATFTGEVELTDIVEGESYRISGKGKGGAAGGASGGAQVNLADAEGGTQLSYAAEAKVTGKIAQLGGRLIDGFAKKLADQFFATFQETVEGPATMDDASAPDAAGTGAAAAGAVAAAAAVDGATEKSGLEETMSDIDEATKGVAASVGSAVDSAQEKISEHLGDMPGSLEEAGDRINDASKGVAASVGAAVDSAQEKISEHLGDMPGSLEEAEERIDEASKDVAANLGEAIDTAQEKLADAVGDLQETLSEAEPLKKSFWKKLFGG